MFLDLLSRAVYTADMRELIRSNDPTVIAFATALLRAEDIDCFVLDLHMSALEGSIGVLPRRMVVHRDFLDDAREILKANDLEISE